MEWKMSLICLPNTMAVALWARAKGFTSPYNFFFEIKCEEKKKQCLHNENEIDKKMKVKNVIWKRFGDTNVIVVKMAIKVPIPTSPHHM